jgi:hypothetical protein
MKVLFLDIDGVLNSRKYLKFCVTQGILPDDKIDPEAVARLNQITAATDAKIVVSSTWRLPYVWNKQLDRLVALLQKNGIKGDIIGMTPDHQRSHGRGGEIQDWMRRCKLDGIQIETFVILDDDNDMGDLDKFLVQTTFSDGLLDTHVQAAIDLLKKK